MKLFPIVAGILLSLNAFAQSSQQTVVELLDKSGSTAQIRQMDNLFASKMEEKKSKFPNIEDFNKFSTLMKSSMNAKDAEIYFTEYFRLKTNEDSLKKIIKLYENPMLQEFNKMELEASSPSKQQEQIAFFQSFQTNPPAKERILLLSNLNNELGVAEITVKMVKNIILSMIKGANQFLPKEQQVSESDMESKLNSELPANFAQQLSNQMLAMSLFTYKNASDNQLEQYLKIWQTPIGKYFVINSFNAYDYTFSKMGEKMGYSFKELDKNKVTK